MIKLKHILKEFLIDENELFHATSKKAATSIVQNGVDISKSGEHHLSAGADQGEGFYLYKDKKRALDHAKEYNGEIILIIDKNISLDSFDIDYEGSYAIAADFLKKNMPYVQQHQKELGIMQITQRSNETVLTIRSGSSFGGMSLDTDDVSIAHANKMASVFYNLEKTDRKMFDQFEIEVLSKAPVLKYNGKDKLFPSRIEDLQGNVLWKK